MLSHENFVFCYLHVVTCSFIKPPSGNTHYDYNLTWPDVIATDKVNVVCNMILQLFADFSMYVAMYFDTTAHFH